MTSRSAQPRSRALFQRRFAALLASAVSLLASVSAGAQPSESVELIWNAPPECPQADDVRARVHELAGPLEPSSNALRAEATIARRDDGQLHLRLLVRSGGLLGERNIDGQSCESLAGATAVALALLLRSAEPLEQGDLGGNATPDAPTPGGSSTAPDASPARGPAATAKLGPARQGSSERGQPAPRRWRALLQAPQITVGVGPLRQLGLGLPIAAGVAFEDWRFLARGSFWFPQSLSTTGSDGQPYGADVHRFSGALLACRAFRASRFELAPCASLSVEHVSARGSGPHIAARTANATWLALGLGARAKAEVSTWLSFVVGVEGQVETSSPQLTLDGVGPIDRLLPAAAAVTVGPEWIF